MFKKIIHKYFALEEIKELGRECSHYILKLFYFSTEADPEHTGRICPLPFFFCLRLKHLEKTCAKLVYPSILE